MDREEAFMKRAAAMALVVMIGASVHAQTTACDELAGRERATAEHILSSEYLYDCCDETISHCLEARPTCALAVRIADNVCLRVAAGQDEVRVKIVLT